MPRRKCRNPECRAWFQPWNTLQQACSVECAKVVGKQNKAAERRERGKRYLEKHKSVKELIRELQPIFNKYIRLRDADKPCISCGAMNPGRDPVTGGQWDCGHYKGTKAHPELRFAERNAHKQCVTCNRFLEGSTVEYRKGLIERIGQENVDWLEQEHSPKQWTREELRDLKAHYRRLNREMERKAS